MFVPFRPSTSPRVHAYHNTHTLLTWPPAVHAVPQAPGLQRHLQAHDGAVHRGAHPGGGPRLAALPAHIRLQAGGAGGVEGGRGGGGARASGGGRAEGMPADDVRAQGWPTGCEGWPTCTAQQRCKQHSNCTSAPAVCPLQALGSTMYFFDSQREGYLPVSNEASRLLGSAHHHALPGHELDAGGACTSRPATALSLLTGTPPLALPPLCRSPGGATRLWLITTPPSPWPPPCPTTPAWGWAWDRWVGAQWSQQGREPAEAAV